MCHVGQRILELAVRQRSVGPVGKARTLVDPVSGDVAHDVLVTHRLSEAADHRRDLGVEQGPRDYPAAVHHDLDVLAGGVEHLEHAFVVHQGEERAEIDLSGQRIDDVLAFRARHLDQAQFRPVRRFTLELRVHRHERMGGKFLAGVGESLGRGYDSHWPVYSAIVRVCRDERSAVHHISCRCLRKTTNRPKLSRDVGTRVQASPATPEARNAAPMPTTMPPTIRSRSFTISGFAVAARPTRNATPLAMASCTITSPIRYAASGDDSLPTMDSAYA